MNKIQSVRGKVDVLSLYEDLVDTVKVLEAMRTSDPKKAISLSDYKKLKSKAHV